MRSHSYALAVLALAGSSLARPDGVGGHHHHVEHGASAPAAVPASGYATPDASYSVPEASYEPSYGVPDSGYAQPSSGYGEPATGYGEPEYTYAQETSEGNGLSMVIIPLLIAAALFLLFPSITTVPVNTGTGRKRRGVEESPAENMVSRVQDMYMAILESEECFERIACELGGLVEDAGYSKQMTKTMEMFAPKKYAKMVKSFNHGKDCKKNNKCGYF